MELATLALFVDVAHAGGFAPVARQRLIDPSLVSRAIAGLEGELGFRLFQRSTRRLALTEAGARYLASVEPLVRDLSAAAEMARGSTLSGRLSMSASVAYGTIRLVPLLPALRAAHPGLDIVLDLTDRLVDVVAEPIDIAIRMSPTIPPGLIGLPLHPSRYHAYASPGWLAQHGPVTTPADLASRPCLLFAGPLQRRDWRFSRPDDGAETVIVGGPIAISSPLALKAACIAGMGATLLTDWLAADAVAAGRLVRLLPDHEATSSAFGSNAWLLYASRTLIPPKLRAGIDFLSAALGQ
ncbi:MAG: LysR family transcriptional regulator [Sphingomonadales bacterium]|jgi:DNA-binding transcriptional LysR family regulator